MCYANGSIEQVTRTCVMCKVCPPRLGCPHQPLGLCRNRQNHPRFDVVHFRNAELGLLNGCGYCKWAKKHQSSTNDKAWFNTGWPGCCRPPKASEYSYIRTSAEWAAVSIIHGVAIPLEAAQHTYHTSPYSGSLKANSLSKRANQPAGKTSPIIIHSPLDKERSEKDAVCMSNGFVSPPTGHTLGTTSPDTPATEAFRTPKRKGGKLPNQTAPSYEKAQEIAPRNAVGKALVSASVPVMSVQPITISAQPKSVVKTDQDPTPPPRSRRSMDATVRHRTSLVDIISTLNTHPSVEVTTTSSSASTSTNSKSGGSTVDSATITSDGFTDYLSDESDQELQRQAEIKAAEIAFAQQEKAEFDAALQTVRHLCLQPPPEWSSSLPATRPKVARNPSLSTFQGPSPLPITTGHSRR